MPESGICPACQTTRLSRRGDPLCTTCTPRARETVTHPLWLFDSPLMRRALAQVNVPAVPAIVRAACGLSQADLAVIAGWSRSALGLYERGQRDGMFDIRMLLQFADAVDMPRAALLPLVLGQPNEALANSTVLETDVDRRSFGALAAGSAAAVMLPDAAVPSVVTASHIRYLQASAESLWSRDQVVGGAVLLRSALRLSRRAQQMLTASSYPEEIGQALLKVAGNLSVCAGWLAFDGGDVPLAQRLSWHGQKLASDAGDLVLSAQALAQLSMLASYTARTSQQSSAAREALQLAHRAADEARYEPMPRLHAHIALRHAYAASLLGDTAAFRSAVTRARRELDRGPRIDDPEWIQIVDETEITGYEARGRAYMGDWESAAAQYRDSLKDHGLSPRNRVCGQAQLAAMLAKGGDASTAVTEGVAVLSALEGGMTSIRTLRELEPVRTAARGHASDEFCSRFDAVEKRLTTAYNSPAG